MLTEADGGPVAVVVKAANVHDSLLLQDALEAVIVEPPKPSEYEQHLCLDKAFSGARLTRRPACSATSRTAGRSAEEKIDLESGKKKHPARRWVVERTIGWLNRCRGIIIRYEKKAENYLAVVQLACGLLWYRRLHRLTT